MRTPTTRPISFDAREFLAPSDNPASSVAPMNNAQRDWYWERMTDGERDELKDDIAELMAIGDLSLADISWILPRLTQEEYTNLLTEAVYQMVTNWVIVRCATDPDLTIGQATQADNDAFAAVAKMVNGMVGK